MLIFFYFLFIFTLGAIVGSFLNVVVLRYGTGQGIVSKRSGCFSCGKTLSWFELVPIFSFVFQGGRCKACKSKISWQYIAVEILTGIVFILVFIKVIPSFSLLFGDSFSGVFSLIFYWAIFSILIAISVYDFRHKIIPDGLVYTFTALSFIGPFIIHNSDFIIPHLLAGPLIASPFFFLWLISRGGWMGFGDVKLAFGIGFLLGIQNGIYAITWSFWIGGFFGTILLILSSMQKNFVNSGKLPLLSKRFTIKSEIPFGPFLVLGTAIAFFMQWDFLNLELIFSIF